MSVNNGSYTYHHPTPWDSEFVPMTLPDLLARATAHNPQAPFLHFMGRTFTYGDIKSEAQRFASGLRKLGIKKGDRVGLFLPNVPIYASAYYGAMLAGAIVVNFSPLYSVEELAWQVSDSGTKALVTVDVPDLYTTAAKVHESSELDTLIVGRLSDMLPALTSLAVKLFKRADIAKVAWGEATLQWASLQADAPEEALSLITPDDLALLQYTGGTTGRPKGAMLGHSQLSM
ncbi:MAG: AMP-binding protein, partial [Pseudomonadota bacterium]